MAKPIRVTILGDASKLERELGSAEGSMGKFGDSAKKMGGLLAGAFAITALADFGTDLFNSGKQLEEWRRKSEAVFGDQLEGVQEWADANNTALGITDEALVNIAAGMSDLLKPMGFTAEEATRMTTDTLELSGALASWSGGQYDAAEVSDILAKAMLGERDSLKSLGISMSQAEVDQRALAIAQADGRDEITDMDKALATQQLVLEKSTDAQAAWAEGGEDAAIAQNELGVTMMELKEDIASALIPVFNTLLGVINDYLVPAIENVVNWFKDFRTNIEPWIPLIAGVGAVILLALLPAMLAWAVSAAAAAASMIIAASPVIALGVAIAALVAGIVWAYQNVEIFRDIVDGAFAVIKTVVETVAGNIVEYIQTIIDIGTNVIEFFQNVFAGDFDAALENVKNIALGFVSLITAPFTNIIDVVKNLWDLDFLKDTIVDAIDLVITWVTEDAPGLIGDAALGMFDGIADAFKSMLNLLVEGWNALDLSFTVPDVWGIPKRGESFDVIPDFPEPFPGLADGGHVLSSGTVMVGERGPEFLKLPRGAEVRPLDRGTGSGNQITIHANTNADAGQIGKEVALALKMQGVS
jgi:hypothetical protein